MVNGDIFACKERLIDGNYTTTDSDSPHPSLKWLIIDTARSLRLSSVSHSTHHKLNRIESPLDFELAMQCVNFFPFVSLALFYFFFHNFYYEFSSSVTSSKFLVISSMGLWTYHSTPLRCRCCCFISVFLIIGPLFISHNMFELPLLSHVEHRISIKKKSTVQEIRFFSFRFCNSLRVSDTNRFPRRKHFDWESARSNLFFHELIESSTWELFFSSSSSSFYSSTASSTIWFRLFWKSSARQRTTEWGRLSARLFLTQCRLGVGCKCNRLKAQSGWTLNVNRCARVSCLRKRESNVKRRKRLRRMFASFRALATLRALIKF